MSDHRKRLDEAASRYIAARDEIASRGWSDARQTAKDAAFAERQVVLMEIVSIIEHAEWVDGEKRIPDYARLDGARLDYASLDYASLDGARLDYARLDYASLDGARLVGARLDGARLVGARLDGARLVGARLDGARLVGARLDYARLVGLVSMDTIWSDIDDILSHSPREVPALLAALHEGRVDGSSYQGKCACLVGTLANARGCSFDDIPDLRPNADRPAERWFIGIRTGDTPETNPISRMTAEYVEWWLSPESDVQGGE